jgi:hypothetical protein
VVACEDLFQLIGGSNLSSCASCSCGCCCKSAHFICLCSCPALHLPAPSRSQVTSQGQGRVHGLPGAARCVAPSSAQHGRRLTRCAGRWVLERWRRLAVGPPARCRCCSKLSQLQRAGIDQPPCCHSLLCTYGTGNRAGRPGVPEPVVGAR